MFLALTICVLPVFADNCRSFGTPSDFHGYTLHDFEFNGRASKVVCPEKSASGNPWIWRARFWGHEPQTDVALLENGFHIVYTEVGGLFGSPEAVAQWDAFYQFLSKQHGFGDKPALEGMSRGGLIIYNWAIANPEKVACIYADAPVLDISSWPGGKGEGKGSRGDWRAALKAYGISEREYSEFNGNPIDNLKVLAKAKIPLLHVIGAADDVVPPGENSDILQKRYKKLGGEITVISKPGVGHHPHSLKDPKAIVDFILTNTKSMDTNYFDSRNGITNSGAIFTQTQKGRVAFLGGSITEMNGWRALIYKELGERFQDTEFDFVDAGISSTDSTLGAFRLESTVFKNGKVDLLFVEFAVNDNHNSRTTEERVRGMEGIIRHARTLNPNIDIIVQYFAEPSKMELYNRGEVPPEIIAHDKVTSYYQIPAINLAKEVTDRINHGDFTWKDDFKNLHPSPFGHRLYRERIARLFDVNWVGIDLSSAKVTPHTNPDTPIDTLNYGRGRYLNIQTAEVVNGWNYLASWNPKGRAG